jgi:hypothetical protein
METAPTKEAGKKRRPEKRLTAAGASPVGQPSGKEEVSDKSESEDKSGNEKQDLYLRHRKHEERKNYEAYSAINTPSICILPVHPGSFGLV